MVQAVNFISFHDLTPEGHYIWASPTVYEVLGYDQEDLVGVPGYNIIYPDDMAESKAVHKENLFNDLVASQIVVRYKGKDGRPVPCACVFSLCYDFIVNCATLLDPSAEACKTDNGSSWIGSFLELCCPSRTKQQTALLTSSSFL